MEEAGCVPTGLVHWFASFIVTNHAKPWKDWHPYPVSAWLIGVVPVRRVGPPTNPPDAETVSKVELLEPPNAIAYLSQFDNCGQAELVALAVDLGLLPELSGDAVAVNGRPTVSACSATSQSKPWTRASTYAHGCGSCGWLWSARNACS